MTARGMFPSNQPPGQRPWEYGSPSARVAALLASYRRHRRGLRKEDGATLIEFAITISVALTLVFVIMQLCLALYMYGMISETAREATRWAIVRGSTCVTGSGTSCTTTTAAITTYAKDLGFPNVGGGTLVVTPTYPDTNPVGGAANCQAPGCRVKVVVTYTVAISLPMVPRNSIPLQTSSEMYILQ
jgi:Flp pilus assembly protein TadG